MPLRRPILIPDTRQIMYILSIARKNILLFLFLMFCPFWRFSTIRNLIPSILQYRGSGNNPRNRPFRYLTASNAASSAAIRSSAFSIPTERRIVFGLMPCSDSSSSVLWL